MKKLALYVLSIALLSVAVIGCGNSPDGDSGRLKSQSSISIGGL